MPLTNIDLRSIVARSSTLWERNAPAFRAAGAGHGARVQRRLDRLKNRAAGADPVRFARYLRWHGVDQRALRRALDDVVYDGDGLPEWATVLEQLDPGRAPADPRSSCPPQPFEHALVPWLDWARARVATNPIARRRLSPGALQDLERGLLGQLVRIAGRTLFVEFSAFRTAAAALRSSHPRASGGAAASTCAEYDRFIVHLRNGGLERILLTYPVLARLVATCLLNWARRTLEFLERCDVDAPMLASVFGDRRRLGRIASIAPGLSDPHRGGGTVSRITFDVGLQLVYKPRSLAAEGAFSALLSWLDGRLTLPLRAPRVLDRGTHGWMENVGAAGCLDAAAVERYYRRSGMLLCLAYVFGASDLHQGNIIASGEHPVLIDLEAFVGAPVRQSGGDARDHDREGQQVWDSVLRTGLLPVDRLGLWGRPHRNGGFVAADPGYGRCGVRWRNVNTDWMTVELRPYAPWHPNLPCLEDVPQPVEDHVDAVTDGFREAAGVLQRARSELLNRRSVLQQFRGARTRVVLRDTGAYATLIDQGLHPRLVRDGADWSIELELLKATATRRRAVPRDWPTWLAEQREMVAMDVPLFTSTPNGVALEADGDGGVVRGYLAQSGMSSARSRLAQLDAGRTDVHLHCIRLALRRRPPHAPGGATDPRASVDPASTATTEVMRIARMLQCAADVSAREVRWIGIRGLDGSTCRSLWHVGWDLYGGRCGIALFLAAAESCGAAGDGRVCSRRVLAPLVEILNGGDRAAAVSMQALGALGVGGIVYALSITSRLLGSADLLDAAEHAAAEITPSRIEADERLDLVWGVAGAALGLLALFNVTPQQWILDRIVLCGRHLLNDSPTRRRSGLWPNAHGEVRNGFAHGRAGIAYTLARLYRQTSVDGFRRAAEAALVSDRRRASRRKANASSIRTARAEALRRSWCRGAAGHALSKVEIASLIGCGESVAGIETLLEETSLSSASMSPADHMCCGNMGRVEVLARAARVLDDPRWDAAAQEGARLTVQRATARGGYSLSGIDDVFSPGYYHGLSGIGYGLLHLRFPQLPWVMSWE